MLHVLGLLFPGCIWTETSVCPDPFIYYSIDWYEKQNQTIPSFLFLAAAALVSLRGHYPCVARSASLG